MTNLDLLIAKIQHLKTHHKGDITFYAYEGEECGIVFVNAKGQEIDFLGTSEVHTDE